MEPTDEILIDRYRGGDAGALEELARRWEAPARDLAMRLLGNREEAQEAGQAALFRAFAGLRRFDGRARFSTWMHRVIVNQCRDRQRRQRKRPAALVRDPAAPSHPDPLIREERSELVRRAVADLPEDEREALLLKHYGGLSFSEVGEVLAIPTTTVKSRVARALDRLRRRLAPRLEDPR
ncbi:MAG: sigma-70 family RNA polymerase sigma factor [Planctomycetota bacterium]